MGAFGAGLRTALLFLVLTGIFVGFGWVIGTLWFGSWVGATLVFLAMAGVMNLVSYLYADRIVLWSYRAREVSESEAPGLYRVVRRVAGLSGVPVPKVVIVPSHTPNAFATGRNPQRAVVGVTEGLLRTLGERELTAVIAHELAHVRDRDILVMSIAATVAGAISFLARAFWWSTLFGGGSRDRNGSGLMYLLGFVGLLLAPIAALLVQLAISRSREYKADYVGATTLGAPDALADALETLEVRNRQRPMEFGSPASSSLWIVNPFTSGAFASIFSTHPPVGTRVERLRLLARGTDTY